MQRLAIRALTAASSGLARHPILREGASSTPSASAIDGRSDAIGFVIAAKPSAGRLSATRLGKSSPKGPSI
jgi:hypothetical protein